MSKQNLSVTCVTNLIRTANARNACCRRLTYITQKTGRTPEKQEKGRENGSKLGRRNFKAQNGNLNEGMH